MKAWACAMSSHPPHPHSMPGHTPGHRLVDPEATDSERTYALVCHLSLLAMHATGVPILGPILWLIRRHDSPFLDDHGKEAVNFQITIFIYAIASLVLTTICVGIPLLIATYIFAIIGSIMGAVAAHRGEFFRYPMCLRLIG